MCISTVAYRTRHSLHLGLAFALTFASAQAGLTPKLTALTNSVGMRLIPLSPGTFTMGSDDGPEHERPSHAVTVSHAFYLGETEVTQGQWVAVMGFNPSRGRGPSLPVTQVNYMACSEFCRRLTLREREAGALRPDAEYRLPTEAEWEYACRAGSREAYCFGSDPALLEEHAWHKGNSANRLHTVARKRPNAWGFYDMHGNVGEWCQDLFRRYVGGSDADHRGASSDVLRAIRGGGFDDPPAILRSSDRCAFPSERRHYSLGFRVVRTVPPKPK